MEIFTSRACVCARPESVSRGRLFVCGDIHGCYDELMQQLRLVGSTRDAIGWLPSVTSSIAAPKARRSWRCSRNPGSPAFAAITKS